MLTALAPADGDAILPLADVRSALNLTADDSFHDARIIRARDAAIDFAEGYTGKALSRRLFTYHVAQFSSVIALPIGPVVADDAAISYSDGDGGETALVEADWTFGGDSLFAPVGTGWPLASGFPGSVRITFTAGYETPDDIPPMIMAGVVVAMAAMFENAASPDLSAAMRCLDRHRAPIL